MRYQVVVLSLLVAAMGANAGEDVASTVSATVDAKPKHITHKKNVHKIKRVGPTSDEGPKDTSRKIWVELAGRDVSTVELKTTKNGRGWALAVTDFEGFKLQGDTRLDANGAHINDGVSELAFMRTFSRAGRWFYTDASVGIGYMKATFANDCDIITASSSGATYVCNKDRKEGLSIPMEVDLAVGRYVGIGLKLRASIGPESTVGFAVTVPLGNFAKQ
jgi:hypothetical protein